MIHTVIQSAFCTLWTEVIEEADFKGKNVVKQNLPVYIYNL
jgi:hypothetical protein